MAKNVDAFDLPCFHAHQ